MNKEINNKIPVIFQKLQDFTAEDTRFLKVKIWLMHVGGNFNNSYFSKEVIEEAIPSLANTPILAYIENNSEGEKDFSDHREILVKENGQYKFKYIGQAIGVIPETNNAQFETRITDSGEEKEYLTVEGLVWTKWDDPIDIFNNNPIKNQSMELHSDYEGGFEDDNLFHFTKFKFFGACALGENILPAMENSTIEVNFSMDTFSKEVQQKMELYKQFTLNQSSSFEVDNINAQTNESNEQEGGNGVDISEILAKYNLTQEQLTFSIEGLSIEEIESKIQEFTNNQNNKTPEEGKTEPIKFSLSNNQLESAIRQILTQRKVIVKDYWGDVYEENEFYLRDIKGSNAIVIDNAWENYYGVPFTVTGDVVSLDFDNKIPYISDWRPKQDGDVIISFAKEEIQTKLQYSVSKSIEKAKTEFNVLETEEYKSLESKISALETENQTLVSFKLTKEKEDQDKQMAEFELKVDEVISQFTFEVEEVKDLKEKTINKELSLEELELNLFALEGKKLHSNKNFSKKEPKDSTVIKIKETYTEESPYGSVSVYFNKK